MKTRYTIIFLSAFLATGCNLTGNKNGPKKDFYNSIAGWDIKHVPIIPPFRASSTYPGQWLINGSKEILHLGKNRGGDIPVNAFGVSKNYIYGTTENGRWFLFNIYSLVYAEYSTEAGLDETLKLLKLDRNEIKNCGKYFQDLANGKRCYWYPNIGEDYPKFEDYQPEKIYTIVVDGNEKATDFNVKGAIKKTVSKLYYFNIKYDNEKNDLLYISFDYSPPQLIVKNKIYTAGSEDNISLNISVYTPLPVAESKGIDEKDRVVLSKQIELE